MSDPHPARTAVLCTLVLIGVTLAWTCFLADAIHHFPGPHRWWIPGDVWVPFPPAHYIANGAFPYLYEAHPAYVYPPGSAILFAPFAAIGERFLLSESTTIVVQRPTMWLLVGPFGVGCSLLPLVCFRQLAWGLGIGRRLDLLQVAVATVAIVPIAIVWGHFEELIVLGALLEATWLTVTGRVSGAGWMVGVAILFKQTAFLALPLFVLQAPPGARRGMLLRALAPVTCLAGICLAADWSHASTALLRASSFPGTGRAAPWVDASSRTVLAGPSRVAAVLAAGIISFAVRDRRDPASFLCALALLSLLRLVFEPVLFAYYVGAPLVFVILASAASGRGTWRIVATGAVTMLLFVPRSSGAMWWAATMVLVVGLAYVPFTELRNRTGAAALSPFG